MNQDCSIDNNLPSYNYNTDYQYIKVPAAEESFQGTEIN